MKTNGHINAVRTIARRKGMKRQACKECDSTSQSQINRLAERCPDEMPAIDALTAAHAMASYCGKDRCIPVTLTIPFHPHELTGLAEVARKQRCTVVDALVDYMANGTNREPLAEYLENVLFDDEG